MRGQKSPATTRAWVKARAARWKAEGGCARCGKRTDVNPHTGKPYSRCLPHRIAASEKQLARYYRQKAEAVAA